ncbi:LysR family transcriptional regulator substrate-binding protein [Herbiconiux sp. VKM Ac-2851]|uniref:LysR family transcriptional regulator substrate-binding protein n=1 Tax=Herbiconiux sp. VKM Ac-2851 TaxID=2739025 RepID=UPI001563B61E|nr:LysR family transcriptional regulator substrate-binding protein [Herbiconiux sp. VKM Ac-2851]NQX34585.1 LysR family transcriptional regulator substrate-binding protein [Herbiconiux sp. VKM Ac-2851]
MVLRVAFVPGVTPSKWVRIWGERFPGERLELLPLDTVALGSTDDLAVLFEAQDARAEAPADATAQPADAEPADAEPAETESASGPADVVIARLPVRTEGVHAIPLYEELPVVVVPADHEITAVDEIALDELEAMIGERMHAPAATPTGGPDAIALVAAGVGAVLLPKSLARLWARKDVDSRPVTGAPSTTVALVWRTDLPAERAALVEEFVGVVRGRTANTSRAAGSTEPPVKQKATAKAKARAAEARAAEAEAKAKASHKKTVAPGRTRPRRAR